jgi:CBS domain-containing protein
MTTPVVTIGADETVEHAARLLLERNISGLPVVDGNGDLVGIVTHSDFFLNPVRYPGVDGHLYSLLGQLIGSGEMERAAHAVAQRKVSDIMRREVTTVTEDTDVKTVAELMLRQDVRRLPVVGGKKVVGIICRHDFVKLALERGVLA